MAQQTIAVIFGGQSSEHVVSCMSVINVVKHINKERYEVILIGITEEGKWLKVDSLESIEDGSWRDGTVRAAILPDATEKSAVFTEGIQWEQVKIDVIFPVLHGLYGEDGTIQGLFELAKIPYVGCGVLSSAVSMDKVYTKIIVDDLGIRQADYVLVTRDDVKESMEEAVLRVEGKLPYPVFVKPSNAGSSKGVGKAENREELEAALEEASRHDRKILVEEMIVGHEVECAVFGGGQDEIRATGVGEILAAADFYDFDAKYYNPESKTVIGPELPGKAAEEIPEKAKAIFKAVDGYGLARVDFFVKEDGEVVFNEINTMPGFTAISMYPMLWEAAGMDKDALVQALIDNAMTRFER